MARDRVAAVKPEVLLMLRARQSQRDQLGFATHRPAEINVELQARVPIARQNKPPSS